MSVHAQRLFKCMCVVVVSFAFAASVARANGTATGLVNTVNVNASWGGFFVQLDNSTSFVYETACPNGNWAFVPLNNPFYNSMLATVLAAKASGQTVVIYTYGCVSTSVGTVPLISVIDYGIRNN